jgi:UDP-glucuronate decarboxylase
MRRVLITGATGFVGTCLLTSHELFGDCEIVGLSRAPQQYSWGPWYKHFQADLNEPLDAKALGDDFDQIIHAATPASAALNQSHPDVMFWQNVQSMKTILEFSKFQSVTPTLLFLSSGAVYGALPCDLDSFSEDWTGAPSTLSPSSAYAEGKRSAELMLSIAASQGIVKGLVSRLFAFSGSLIPLDRHFAVGNFVAGSVNQGKIVVRSDGSSIRSYLDQKDLASWLLRILEVGEQGFAYHVGSERPISIGDLARLTAERFELITGQRCSVEFQGQTSTIDGVDRYVPSTRITREQLHIEETVSLEDSLDSMILATLSSSRSSR